MSGWQNPRQIADLSAACRAFLSREVDALVLQRVIQSAESVTTGLEESWLRDVLMDAESEIELILYTVSIEDGVPAIDAIAQKLLGFLARGGLK